MRMLRRPLRSERYFLAFSLTAIGALLAISLVAAYPQMLELMSGRRSPGTAAGFGLRWLREFVWLIVCAGLGLWLLFGPPRWRLFWRGTAVVVAGIAGYTGLVFARTLLLGVPPEVALAGLRVFQYVPFAWLAFHIATHHPLALFVWVGRFLKALLLVWTPLSIYQVLVAPPFQGRTAFGSRAFATFNEANVFGVAVATCALWFVLTHLLRERYAWRRRARRETIELGLWLALCLTLALLTGSRAALALTVLVIALPLVWTLRRPIDRWAIASLAPLVLIGSLVLGSMPAISGRQTDLLRDGRLAKWREEVIGAIDGPMDLLFGWGLGLGSNTVNTLFGYDYFPRQFVADSHYVFLLNGYGLIGVIVFLALLALPLMRAPRPAAIVFVAYVALLSAPLLPFEVFPTNVLIMLAWGGLMGMARLPPDAPRRPPLAAEPAPASPEPAANTP